MAFEFTDTNFQTEAIDKEGVAVVDFWAEWCGPCRMIGPIIEELHQEYDGKAVVGKVNVDHNPEISMKYGIRSIPTLMVFKGGQKVDVVVGAVPKATLASTLEKHIDS